ncbi:hypothetical protein WG66_014324 [Moniliophthora roreri]|nr:hypothetical protein WG66_014324 [Moniliophthora roreri]
MVRTFWRITSNASCNSLFPTSETMTFWRRCRCSGSLSLKLT